MKEELEIIFNRSIDLVTKKVIKNSRNPYRKKKKFLNPIMSCMKKQRDPKTALFDILDCSKNCIEFSKGMTFDEFQKDLKTISAVQHQLIIIGEAAKKISEEFRNKHDDIP